MNGIHPWKLSLDQKKKLEAARKIAKQRYERTSPVRNDEYHKLLARKTALRTSRRKSGIPIELPKMKPWDYKKSQKQNPI